MNRWLFVFLVLLCGNALAQNVVTAVDITTLTEGSYLLTVKGGTVTVRPINLLQVNPGPNPPPLPPPLPPVIPVLTERAAQIKDAATKVMGDSSRSDTAKALAALYREISKQVAAGKLKGDQIALATKYGADLLLGNKTQSWAPVRSLMSDQWAAVQQRGEGDQGIFALLNDVANGLDASVENRQAQAIDPATWQLILQIIEMIIKIFVK